MSEQNDFPTSAGLPDSTGIATAHDSSEQAWTFDTDGDGVADVAQWNFSDGTWQELVDVDADGKADVLLIDVNGDDTADVQIWDNGDGTYTAAQDTDGDGEFETQQSFTRDELDAAIPGVSDLLDTHFGAPSEVPPVDNPDTSDTGGDAPAQFDTDQDGVVDIVQWSFADGTWQQLVDVDGDASADVLLIDVNGDDTADIQIWDNGDGTYTVLYDADGDGTFEVQHTFDQTELDARLPGAAELLNTHYGQVTETDPPAPTDDTTHDDTPVSVNDDQVAGDPTTDSQYWFQQAENGFCVPSSVAMIVSAYTGDEILSEEQFVEMANELGLFQVDMDGTFGMTMPDALTLLESAGVPAEMVVGDMNTLYDALDEGRGVMLFIDSGEVWYGGEGQQNAPDHAVVITGIDREAGLAYLSDPGNPDGNMEVVPLSVLESAWEDSGFTMIVCDEPAPDFTDGSVPASDSTTSDGTTSDGTTSDGVSDAAQGGLQATTGSLVDSPWALLPVVLPADAVSIVGADAAPR